MEQTKTRINCFIHETLSGGDVAVVAVTENGTLLTQHISSNDNWAKHDIGITSQRKHALYAEQCPDGYDLVWLDAPPVQKQVDAL